MLIPSHKSVEVTIRSSLIITILFTGCYTPDNLPEWADTVPVVGEFVPCASNREVRVDCVIDGDTFDVGGCGDLATERFRMLGIDATETAHNGKKAECWSDVATAELVRLIEGETVTVSFDTTCEGAFGRTLAYIWLPGDEIETTEFTEFDDPEDYQSTLINEELLVGGFVTLYEEGVTDDLRYQSRLEDAEAKAQALGLGLWTHCEE